MLQAEPQEEYPHRLPEDLLVSVFNALDHPRDLLACACVCKAWSIGRAKALLPRLRLGHQDLAWLLQLNPVQMAAIRDLCMEFIHDQPEDAAASAMLLAFVCGRLPRLQRLGLDAKLIPSTFFDPDDFAEVGCTLLPDVSCKTGSKTLLAFAEDLAG